MSTVLVTGGAGFLGSHVCDQLLADGHKVICLDNLNTGFVENINHNLDNPNFEFINHNIIEPIDIGADVIMNLACPASPPVYQIDPIFTFKTCILGALNMLELAKKNNAVFFHASTSEVYGDPIEHPQKEVHWGHVNPIGIRSCYDEGKRGVETLCFDYKRVHNLRIKIVRIFNTYGPRMNPRDGRVVSNFINQAIRNEDITIYGDGSQTRSFCFCSDLIRGILKLTFSKREITGPINLGNPNEFTIRELAEQVLKITGSQSKLVFEPLPQDDPKQRQPDISLASQVLNWKPEVELKEGLGFTIDHFQKVRDGATGVNTWYRPLKIPFQERDETFEQRNGEPAKT